MAVRATFELSGLDELVRDYKKVLRKYPSETEKEVYKLAGRFAKDVNRKFPSSYAPESSKDTLRKWQRTREKAVIGGYTVGIEIRNKAPHWHLVENGHQIKISPERAASILRGTAFRGQKRRRKGRAQKGRLKTVGFVQGKHYCEKTREEWKEEFPKRIQEFVDKMLKEEKL